MVTQKRRYVFLTIIRKTIKLKSNLRFLHLQIITLCIKKIKTLKEINILKGTAAAIRSGKVIGVNVNIGANVVVIH